MTATPSGDGTVQCRVLLAEDDDDMRALLVGWLREAGCDVTACSSGRELLTLLERTVLSGEIQEFDLVVSDVRMPQGSALDVLDEFFGCDGVPPTILITAFGQRRVRAAASQLGAALVLDKPLDKGDLIAAIRRVRSPQPRAADVGGRVDSP